MNEVPSQYNSQHVVDAANVKLREEGVNAAQTVFQSALLDWVDDVTMGDKGDNTDHVKEEIANLWLAYASFNRKSNLVSLLYKLLDFVAAVRVCDAAFLYITHPHRLSRFSAPHHHRVSLSRSPL